MDFPNERPKEQDRRGDGAGKDGFVLSHSRIPVMVETIDIIHGFHATADIIELQKGLCLLGNEICACKKQREADHFGQCRRGATLVVRNEVRSSHGNNQHGGHVGSNDHGAR